MRSGKKAPNCEIKDADLVPVVFSSPANKFYTVLSRESTCLAVEKEARVSEREVLSATGRSFVTTSRVSPSPLSVVWLAVVV